MPLAKRPKLTHKRNNTRPATYLEKNQNGRFNYIPFGGNILQKYFEDSHVKLSELVNNIDKELSDNLSPEMIKDRFIYGIFYKDKLYLKDEFLFLIFVLPEIEVITQLFCSLKNYPLDLKVSDNSLSAYKSALKELISRYKEVMLLIQDKKTYTTFKTIKEITDHFLKAMKQKIDTFRKANLNILKLRFGECQSIEFYEALVNNNSTKENIHGMSMNLIRFFRVFLDQSWVRCLVPGSLFFSDTQFNVKPSAFNDNLQSNERRELVFENINKFVEIINNKYFKNSEQSITQYNLNDVKPHFQPSNTQQPKYNKFSEKQKYTIEKYLLYKYRIYCERLLTLYLSWQD